MEVCPQAWMDGPIERWRSPRQSLHRRRARHRRAIFRRVSSSRTVIRAGAAGYEHAPYTTRPTTSVTPSTMRSPKAVYHSASITLPGPMSLDSGRTGCVDERLTSLWESTLRPADLAQDVLRGRLVCQPNRRATAGNPFATPRTRRDRPPAVPTRLCSGMRLQD